MIDWLGCVPYAEGLERQRKCVEARRSGAGPDRLLLLEHPPVITLGRGGDAANVLADEAELRARGVEVHRVSRGGDVTYHAPGQLVGYLVVDLEARGEADVHAFLRSIEGCLIDALDALGLRAQPRAGMTGVFVAPAAGETAEPPRKLASIGVGLRAWVSHHGFALNVDLDLAGFDAIVACGLHGVEMTSVARELGAAAPTDLFDRSRAAVADAFAARWDGA